MTAHRRGVTATGGSGGGSGKRLALDSSGREAGGAREAAIGERAGAVRQLSGERGVRGAWRAVPTALKAALSAWRVAATRQRRSAAWARRSARRLTSGVRFSSISELKKISRRKLAQIK
jgi:hypothetical protein